MTEWPKKVTVDKRIVQILSGSTYENFPKALRELAVNSYDADASEVNVEIDVRNEVITLDDNGHGLSEDDFDFYLRIAFRSREREDKTQLGRRIVGQFGVGFLSIFPFCQKYHIESKRKASNEIIFADIPCHRYFTQDNRLVDVSEIPIPGGKRYNDKLIEQSFTRIRLDGFSRITKAFFDPRATETSTKFSIRNLEGVEKLKWILSEDLPLEFEDEQFNRLFDYGLDLPFVVTVNGEQLKRKVFGKTIIEKHKGELEEVGSIKFKYFIATDFKPIHPLEARFFKIRNLNVGVGDREPFGAGTETGTRAKLSHLTGEIHILDGMNELISVKRDSFNYSQDYEELKALFRRKLTRHASELDRIADLEKLAKDTRDEFRINDLQLLEPSNLSRKIDELKIKGYKIKESLEPSDSPLKVNKQRKEIEVAPRLDRFRKRIVIKDKQYNVEIKKWNPEKDSFPACRIEGDTLILNRSYPLFSRRKYTDVFFKIHALLLISHKERRIDTKTYRKLVEDILVVFSDYQ